MLKIGVGAGCHACRLPLAIDLARSGQVKYLAFDRQSERTTAVDHLERSRGGRAFDKELETYLEHLLPHTVSQGIKWVTNAGGEDPEGALQVALKTCRELGFDHLRISALEQHDPLPRIKELNPTVLETGEPLSNLDGEILGATLYYGVQQIVDGLRAGADIVITNRVGDPTLYLGPMIHEFGWAMDDWDTLAAGQAVGQLLECGVQVTGGYFASPPYKTVPNLASVSNPIAEVDPDGSAVITKLPEGGGAVTLPIVKEQMLYEVGNPSRYVHTDVIVDFTTARLEEVGPNRIRISGVTGHPRPQTLKALVIVNNGYVGEAYIMFGGSDCLDRARAEAELVRERLSVMGIEPLEFRAAYIGVNSLLSRWLADPIVPREVMLHVAARFRTYDEAYAFEWDCFKTGGCFGVAGGTAGRSMSRIDDMPAMYSVLVPASAFEEPKPVVVDVRPEVAVR